MPEPTAPNLMDRAWRRADVRWGTALALAMLLIGIYAPFLANDVAVVWHDAEGWRLPAVGDLFNRWSYPKYHDVFFNAAALLLPLLIPAGWLLRRRWSLPRRIVTGLLVILACGGACLVPLGGQALWRFRAQPTTVVTAVPAGAWALSAPIPFRATVPVAGAVLLPPLAREPGGRRCWLGSDSAGKDVAAQMIAGARISLTVGLVAAGLSLAIGLLVGATAGFCGGWIDLVLERVVEIMLCFPTFILLLAVVSMVGHDLFVIMTVIGLTSWAGTARLVRGEFLAQSVRDYVAAGVVLGLPRHRLMFRHILPNTLAPLLVTVTFGIASAVGSESGLSFLGLGDPTVASWGSLLNQGQQNVSYGWLIWIPGMAVFVLVSALNLMGNGLREAADTTSA